MAKDELKLVHLKLSSCGIRINVLAAPAQHTYMHAHLVDFTKFERIIFQWTRNGLDEHLMTHLAHRSDESLVFKSITKVTGTFQLS